MLAVGIMSPSFPNFAKKVVPIQWPALAPTGGGGACLVTQYVAARSPAGQAPAAATIRVPAQGELSTPSGPTRPHWGQSGLPALGLTPMARAAGLNRTQTLAVMSPTPQPLGHTAAFSLPLEVRNDTSRSCQPFRNSWLSLGSKARDTRPCPHVVMPRLRPWA